MKQHIAKLLVFLMLMTTMIVPADLSFAESGDENTTQTEESNDPQEKPDSTQETLRSLRMMKKSLKMNHHLILQLQKKALSLQKMTS